MRIVPCECCNGEGTIDMRRFAYADSDPAVECPDCEGAGEYEVPEDPMDVTRNMCR